MFISQLKELLHSYLPVQAFSLAKCQNCGGLQTTFQQPFTTHSQQRNLVSAKNYICKIENTAKLDNPYISTLTLSIKINERHFSFVSTFNAIFSHFANLYYEFRYIMPQCHVLFDYLTFFKNYQLRSTTIHFHNKLSLQSVTKSFIYFVLQAKT